jgi:hypothetical protein
MPSPYGNCDIDVGHRQRSGSTVLLSTCCSTKLCQHLLVSDLMCQCLLLHLFLLLAALNINNSAKVGIRANLQMTNDLVLNPLFYVRPCMG